MRNPVDVGWVLHRVRERAAAGRRLSLQRAGELSELEWSRIRLLETSPQVARTLADLDAIATAYGAKLEDVLNKCRECWERQQGQPSSRGRTKP